MSKKRFPEYSGTETDSVCWIATAFVIGIVCNRFLSNSVFVGLFLAGTVSVLLVLILFGANKARVARSLPALFFLLLGYVSSHACTPTLPYPASLKPFINRPDTLFVAEITAPIDFYPHKTRILLNLNDAVINNTAYPVRGAAQLTISTLKHSWRQGDRLLVRLTLKDLHNFGTPGVYDYVWSKGIQGIYARAYLHDDRFLIRLTEPDETLSTRFSRIISGKIDDFRQQSRQWLQERLPPDTATLYEALLLGYRHEISKEFMEALQRSGVVHLLAISGLHLGLVALVVFWLSRRLSGWIAPSFLYRSSDQHMAYWAALTAALLYALVSGLALPTWRAALMLILFFGAGFLYRYADGFSLLATAALVILIISPNSLWTLSFQLSFGAFLGILAIYPKLAGWEHILDQIPGPRIKLLMKPFAYAFWVSVAVNVVILPLVAYYFHGISLAGLVANAILVPAVGMVVLPLGLLSLVLSTVNVAIADLVLGLGAWFLAKVTAIIFWFSRLSWSYFWVGILPLWFLAVYYTALYSVFFHWKREYKISLWSILGLMILCGTLLPFFHHAQRGENGRLQADIIDVGQGSATLVRFPHGGTMLVDGGGFSDNAFDIGRYVLAPYLWHEHINHLDRVLLSHDQSDHRNGLCFILAHFDVGEYWETGLASPPARQTVLAKIAHRRGIPIRRIDDIFQAQDIDGCRIRVLNPSPEDVAHFGSVGNINNTSMVIQIDFGSTVLVIPGDIDQDVEQRLPVHLPANAKILLIAPHHGSRLSTSPCLLDHWHPVALLISCGYQNRFRFPSRAVLKRCRKRGIPVYRTDINGTITAISNGNRWQIFTYRDSAQNLNSMRTHEPKGE